MYQYSDMSDFTLNTYYRLLKALKEQQFTFQTFVGYLKDPDPRTIILRHDVDARKINSLQTASIENELGITGTYYFRMVPSSFDENVIKQIAGLGHEIGYHYEDLSLIAGSRGWRARGIKNAPLPGLIGNGIKERFKDLKAQRHKCLTEEELFKLSFESFRENLAKLRRVVPIETICMHGSPLSKYDNRLLWEKYEYREYGIIGEPYFDINFEEVLYLTDTGRRWDGNAVNIRDKAPCRQETKVRRNEETKREESLKTQAACSLLYPRFHSTFDIINAAKLKKLPDKIMLTVHPQRWDDRSLPWIRELIWQNIKNVGKKIITSR